MHDDKELLLEAAAIGAGFKALNGKLYGGLGGQHQARTAYDLLCDNDLYWNPLVDDGDALRLAIHLDIELDWIYMENAMPRVRAFHKGISNTQSFIDKKSKELATRLAIVMVAVEIKKNRE